MQICAAKYLNSEYRKHIALDVISNSKSITQAANENNISRKFIKVQTNKALEGINKSFMDQGKNILCYLPITEKRIEQMVLSEILDCRASYRGIIKSLQSIMSYGISLAKISEIFKKYALKAAEINISTDLKFIEEGALDELHHLGIPTLVGVELKSLYCFLLSEQDSRDAETWAIKLLELSDQGFKPDRTFADFAGGLRAGQAIALENIPCFGDLYHALHAINEAKRLIKKIYQGKITATKEIETKSKKYLDQDFGNVILEAYTEELFYKYLFESVATLAGWLHNDLFRIEGYNPETRSMLYNFIVDEFTNLEKLHPKHIRSLRVFLENKKDLLLSFVTHMDQEFANLAEKKQYFKTNHMGHVSINEIWL